MRLASRDKHVPKPQSLHVCISLSHVDVQWCSCRAAATVWLKQHSHCCHCVVLGVLLLPCCLNHAQQYIIAAAHAPAHTLPKNIFARPELVTQSPYTATAVLCRPCINTLYTFTNSTFCHTLRAAVALRAYLLLSPLPQPLPSAPACVLHCTAFRSSRANCTSSALDITGITNTVPSRSANLTSLLLLLLCNEASTRCGSGTPWAA